MFSVFSVYKWIDWRGGEGRVSPSNGFDSFSLLLITEVILLFHLLICLCVCCFMCKCEKMGPAFVLFCVFVCFYRKKRDELDYFRRDECSLCLFFLCFLTPIYSNTAFFVLLLCNCNKS